MSDSVRETGTFPRFFNAQELGRSMREVATDLISTTHQDVVSRWFHGPKEVDLYLWLDKDQNLLKQQISFYGQVVEWNIIEGVKTGMVIEDEPRGSGVNASEVIRFDKVAQQGSVEQAIELVRHIEGLKVSERESLIANFNLKSIVKINDRELTERFSAFLKEPIKKAETPVKESLFATLKSYLKRWF